MTIPPGETPGVPGTSGAAGTGAGFESLPSPLDAVDDQRSAAKWTLATAGAIGAVLIAGPLVAVGQVHGGGDAVIAGLGLVIALCGVGLAIWSTSKVLSRLTTRATFSEPALATLVARIEKEPEQFFGVAATTVDGLFKRQDDNRTIAANLARQAAATTDLQARAKIQAQGRRVEENAARVAIYIRWLLALGHVWTLQEDLRRSRLYTLAGGVLVVIGAVLFFSVTESSEPTYVPVLTPAVTATPTAGAHPTAAH